MLSLCRKAFLATLLTSSLAANLGSPTSGRAKHAYPTVPVAEALPLAKLTPRSQQPAKFDTCGYRDGRSNQPLVCPGYFFCNTNNYYNYVACCADAATTSGYHPYGCTFYYTCFDSTQSASLSGTIDTTMPATQEGGDKIKAMYCSDASSPYCNTQTFTDNGHSLWLCGTQRDVTQTYALSYDTSSTSTAKVGSTITKSSSTTVVTTMQVTPTATASHESLATISQLIGTSASEASDQSDSTTSPPNRTGIIIGGAVGGVAALALGAAIVMFLKTRKKTEEDIDENGTKPSFEFNGSNVAPRLPPVAPADLLASPPPRTSTPYLSEVGGDDGRPVKPLVAPSVVYQPYHRQQNDSISTFELSSNSPYRSHLPSRVQPQPYTSNPSYIQLSEVDGVSACSSRHNTNFLMERRQSRFAELDACHMSMQSGPIPEWDARELP